MVHVLEGAFARRNQRRATEEDRFPRRASSQRFPTTYGMHKLGPRGRELTKVTRCTHPASRPPQRSRARREHSTPKMRRPALTRTARLRSGAVGTACLLLAAYATSLASPRLDLRRQLVASENATAPAPSGASSSNGLSLIGALIGSPECHSAFDTNGGVALFAMVTFYTFVGLAIVCDEYFCPSLEHVLHSSSSSRRRCCRCCFRVRVSCCWRPSAAAAASLLPRCIPRVPVLPSRCSRPCVHSICDHTASSTG
jgi:hypothetical protein